jgi:beta-xylosidase
VGLLVAMVAGGGGSLFLSAGRAGAAGSSFQSPVYAGDFPDPSVLLVNGTYWAYSTGSGGRNLQVMSSPDLHSWTTPAEALAALPSWASPGRTWAPGVTLIGGTYVMYYTVRDTALAMQCISVATASTPGGPFADSSPGPLVCQTTDGGSIDPNPFLDPVSGNLFLIWKSDDNSIGLKSHIWAEQLAPSGLGFAAGTVPSKLLTESAAWQSPTIEGPTMFHYGSTYYLFYGANSWSSAGSGIGYAKSSTLLGSYSNKSTLGTWLGTTGNAQGPQGPMIFKDTSNATRLAFAAWDGPVGYQNGGARSLWVASLGFNQRGKPIAT